MESGGGGGGAGAGRGSGGAGRGLAVVLGRLLGRQDERSQAGQRFGHFQELMLQRGNSRRRHIITVRTFLILLTVLYCS